MSRSGMFLRKPKRQKPPREVRLAGTFWNGEPTKCTKVKVTMGPAPENWWCAGMEGTVRDAVRIEYHGDVFYIDNEGGFTVGDEEARPGDGWLKVTLGMGGPDYRHGQISNCTEVEG